MLHEADNHRDVMTMASVMRVSDLDRELAARRRSVAGCVHTSVRL
jgi:hypothetical protein